METAKVMMKHQTSRLITAELVESEISQKRKPNFYV